MEETPLVPVEGRGGHGSKTEKQKQGCEKTLGDPLWAVVSDLSVEVFPQWFWKVEAPVFFQL